MNKPDVSPAVKSNDTAQTIDSQKTADAESLHNTTSNDQTLSSPKSSDEIFTSPKLPPLIPDAEKEKT